MLILQVNNMQVADNREPLFPIGTVAELLKVHPRTLRIYDDAGILVSSRSEKNRRKYSLLDIEKAVFIQYLTRDMGINIIGVKIILQLLEAQKIKPSDYKKMIDKIAKKLNITEEIQEETRKKLSKRGRKPKVKS